MLPTCYFRFSYYFWVINGRVLSTFIIPFTFITVTICYLQYDQCNDLSISERITYFCKIQSLAINIKRFNISKCYDIMLILPKTILLNLTNFSKYITSIHTRKMAPSILLFHVEWKIIFVRDRHLRIKNVDIGGFFFVLCIKMNLEWPWRGKLKFRLWCHDNILFLFNNQYQFTHKFNFGKVVDITWTVSEYDKANNSKNK